MPTKDEIVAENERLTARVEELEQALKELAPQDDVSEPGSDVMTQLAEAKARAAALEGENEQLRAQVAELERQARGDAAADLREQVTATWDPGLTDDGLCAACFPQGWAGVHEGLNGVGCQHGSFTRPAEQN